MDKPTQLFDEKMDAIILNITREGSGAFTWSEAREIASKAFAEGYNARTAEENAIINENPKYDLTKILKECRKMIEDGFPINALRLYKTSMGTSLTEAKAALNL